MKKRTLYSIAASTLVSVLAVTGITFAAANPAASDTSLLNKGTVEVDSLKVGKQDVGGVTFFNGTIVNSTTNNGVDNPVTFGDDVRIDGRIFRGDTAGPGSNPGEAPMPVIFNDDVQFLGNVDVPNGTLSLNQSKKLSVPAAAFTESEPSPAAAAKYFSNQGSFLTNLDTANGRYFYAPLYLPGGATITQATMHYANDSTSTEVIDANVTLHAHGASQASTSIARLAAVNGQNSVTMTDTGDLTIGQDNSYYIGLYMPLDNGTGDSEFYEIVIDYSSGL